MRSLKLIYELIKKIINDILMLISKKTNLFICFCIEYSCITPSNFNENISQKEYESSQQAKYLKDLSMAIWLMSSVS